MSPLPDKATCCGLSLLLSLIARVAVLVPAPDGLKVMSMPHVAAGTTLAPQVVDGAIANSDALVPPKVNPLMARAELPVLVSVIVLAALVEPTGTPPKLKLCGTSFTVPDETVILAVTDFVESETAVAVSVTAPPEGTVPGAV